MGPSALDVKRGGMGITRGSDIADAAYVLLGRPLIRTALPWMRNTCVIMVRLGGKVMLRFWGDMFPMLRRDMRVKFLNVQGFLDANTPT